MTPSERMAAQRLFEQELAKEQALYNQRVSGQPFSATSNVNTGRPSLPSPVQITSEPYTSPRRIQSSTMPSDGMATSRNFLGNWWDRTFGKKPAASAPSSGVASQGQGMSRPLQRLGTVADDAAKATSRSGLGKFAMAGGGVPLVSGLADAGLGLASGESVGKAAAGGVGNAVGTWGGMKAGALAGAKLGTFFGPKGVAVGGLLGGAGAFVGGLLGGMGGSAVGDGVYNVATSGAGDIVTGAMNPIGTGLDALGKMTGGGDTGQQNRTLTQSQEGLGYLPSQGSRQSDAMADVYGNPFNPLDNSPRSAQEDSYERQLQDAYDWSERQKEAQFERDRLLSNLSRQEQGDILDSQEAVQLMSLYDQLQGRANNAVQTVIGARYF